MLFFFVENDIILCICMNFMYIFVSIFCICLSYPLEKKSLIFFLKNPKKANRGVECMDLVMVANREWACEPEVDGIWWDPWD